MQYYIFAADSTGIHFISALRTAARRGVRVRLLVDDLHLADPRLVIPDLQSLPNFEVRVFNPLPARSGSAASRILRSMHQFSRINHRMHNKLLVADGLLSISGGRNIADEYFMRAADANFIDMDVLAAGPVVPEQSRAFDAYWNSEHTYPLELLRPPDKLSNKIAREMPASWWDNLDITPAAADIFGSWSLSNEIVEGRLSLTWAPARVMADPPSKLRGALPEERMAGTVTETMLGVLAKARSRIFVSSPYFAPGRGALEVIEAARARGVQFTLVTNSLDATDEPVVHSRYVLYRNLLLEIGAAVYEISPSLAARIDTLGSFKSTRGVLHSKVAIVDDRFFYIGSMNFDRRSASLNTEAGLLIDSTELARQFGSVLQIDRFRSAYRVEMDAMGDVRWLEASADGAVESLTHEPGMTFGGAVWNLLLLAFIDEEWL